MAEVLESEFIEFELSKNFYPGNGHKLTQPIPSLEYTQMQMSDIVNSLQNEDDSNLKDRYNSTLMKGVKGGENIQITPSVVTFQKDETMYSIRIVNRILDHSNRDMYWVELEELTEFRLGNTGKTVNNKIDVILELTNNFNYSRADLNKNQVEVSGKHIDIEETKKDLFNIISQINNGEEISLAGYKRDIISLEGIIDPNGVRVLKDLVVIEHNDEIYSLKIRETYNGHSSQEAYHIELEKIK